jgi:predicted phage-related endonuclease
LPDHYQWQVQHQLMITKADVADVFIFDGIEGVIFLVAPDASVWPRIHAAWDEFAHYVTDAQAPPLSDRDVRIRDDPEWLEAAAKYVELRTAYEELSAKVDEAKKALIAKTEHPKEQGGGVLVTRLWKRGNIEYKRVPELVGVDLEQYRGAARQEVRVTI